MGQEHCTYELSWGPLWPNGKIIPDQEAKPQPTMDEISREIAQLADGACPRDDGYQHVLKEWDQILNAGAPAQWLDHETHMGAVSRKWPETIFRLTIQDREQRHTMDYCLAGMVQTVQGEIVFPPFQRDRLREPRRDGQRPPEPHRKQEE